MYLGQTGPGGLAQNANRLASARVKVGILADSHVEFVVAGGQVDRVAVEVGRLAGAPVVVIEGLVAVVLCGEPEPGPGAAEGRAGVSLRGGVEPEVFGASGGGQRWVIAFKTKNSITKCITNYFELCNWHYQLK